MTGMVRERLDRTIVVLIVMGCLATVVWQRVSRQEHAVNAATIKAALAAVHSAMEHNAPQVVARPDYLGTFLAHMGKSEQPLRADQVAWIFWPRPPYVVVDRPPPLPESFATLSRPGISRAGIWVGKAVIRVSFGASDRNWQARALQVWRRKPADAGWPEEALWTIRATAQGAVELPPNAVAVSDGYEIPTTDQPPRTPWEYRVRTAAVFPEEVEVSVAGKPAKVSLKLPDDAAAREDLLSAGDAAAELGALLLGRTPAFQPLAGSPFVSRFSETITVELPGDTQISYEAPATVDDREFANFRFRYHRPDAAGADRDGWCVKLERFVPGDDLRLPGHQLFIRDPAAGRIRPEAVDIDSGAKLVRLYVKTVPTAGMPRTERIAVIQDKAGRREIELVARADGGGWWPKDPPLTPRAEEPKPAGPPAPAIAAKPDAPPAAPPPAPR